MGIMENAFLLLELVNAWISTLISLGVEYRCWLTWSGFILQYLLLQIFVFTRCFMSHCHTIIATLRQRGYRITPQREMVIEIIAHANRHLSAEEIYAEVKKHTRATNIATVYRTLDLLVEHGMVSRIDLGEGQIVYAASQHGPHIHLVCRQCGQVTDAAPDMLQDLGAQLAEHYHFAPDLKHISIFGLCVNCQKGD